MNYDQYLKIFEKGLIKYLPKTDGMNDTVIKAAEYSLLNGGKRLRPVIVLSVSDIFGSLEDALPFAAAIEMIHTYSLIHDDLPAMDDDDYRRGKPSCHKKFGEWAAVLAGDALLNTAFEVMLAAVSECHGQEAVKRRLKAAGIIGSAAGARGMISGQTADMEWEGKSPGEQTLTSINQKKTGAIIAASFESGAIIGGAGPEQSAALCEAGKKIGLAFQIRDDMLDYEGSLETLGKQAGSDLKNGKTTYVSVLGLEGCAKRVEGLSTEAIRHIKSIDKNTAFLENLITGLICRNN